MKKFKTTALPAFITAALLALTAAPAFSAELMVASTMQRCTTNEECTLVTKSCADNCGFVPVNKSNLGTLQTMYQSRCGKPMEANPSCNMNPPIAAACVNSRCTIDYAYANHAGAKDYKSGAYPVPEAAVPSKVPGDYTRVNDRNGQFTAYDLPKGDVRQSSVGQLTERVYVPPSAPVSGGNYVPVGTPPAPAQMPQAQAPVPPQQMAPAPVPSNIPPAAIPVQRSNATPPVTRPANPVPQNAPVMTSPAPAPSAAPMPMPTPMTNAAPAPATMPGEPLKYVPTQAAPTIPAPGLPPASTAAPRTPRAPSPAPVASSTPAVPAVGAPGVPQAPAGSVPIPPSDLKPAPTFVPPTGTAIPVSPEDPGAPPPPGSVIMLPTDAKVSAPAKSFTGLPGKKSTDPVNQ